MTAAESIAKHTCPGELYEPLEGNRIRCLACGHRCPIPAGFAGVCRVRFNQGGTIRVPFGYVNALQVDPIEKKPFFHVLPGATTLSFGMLGCSFHCRYCQNWATSQALREIGSRLDFHPISPAQILQIARTTAAAAVVSTYNEPLITAEWSAEVFRAVRAAGLLTGFVSNGNATPNALQYLRPSLDLFKVDLKTMSDRRYRSLGGRLAPVLDSIAGIFAAGFWLEVVTLIVPGFNDSNEELLGLAQFLTSVSPDIPWHVTAFRPDFKMTGVRETPANTLLRAASIGHEAGLRYVYVGNLPGSLGDLQNTRCPCCGSLLVERRGFCVLQNRLVDKGRCPACGTRIPGMWGPVVTSRSRPDDRVIRTRCG